LRGRFLDLFEAGLPIVESVSLVPGSRRLLFDLHRPRPSGPSVLASACKVLGARTTPDGAFQFHAEGPDQIEAVVCVALPAAPKDVLLDPEVIPAGGWTWHDPTRTLRFRFPNSAAGHLLTIRTASQTAQ
jgi:hypothetical protein